MSKFAKNFLMALREQDELDPDLEREAMEDSMDEGIDAAEFDTDMNLTDKDKQATDEVADAISKRNQQIINDLQTWIDEIETFLNFLNSEDPNSVQSRLAAAEPDTVLDKMKQSQQTKISRVASDLASLHQNFLGFMAQTTNARYKYIIWPISFGLGFLSMLSTGMNYFC